MAVALDRCRMNRMAVEARNQRQRARFEHREPELLSLGSERRGDVGKDVAARGIDNRHAVARVNEEAPVAGADVPHALSELRRIRAVVDDERYAESGHRWRTEQGLRVAMRTLAIPREVGNSISTVPSSEALIHKLDHVPAVGFEAHVEAEHLQHAGVRQVRMPKQRIGRRQKVHAAAHSAQSSR